MSHFSTTDFFVQNFYPLIFNEYALSQVKRSGHCMTHVCMFGELSSAYVQSMQSLSPPKFA